MYKESDYYTLFKRVRSGKVIWHYYAYNGKRRVLRSTGKSKRADALSVIGERIKTGTLIYPEGIRPQRETRGRSVPPGGSAEGADILFIDYCMSIWDYDRSDYLRRRNKEKPNSVSRKHAEEMTGALSRYVAPGVRKGLRLNEFDPSVIMRIKDRMVDDGFSSSAVNKMLQSVRTPMEEAYVKGLVPVNFKDRLKNIAPSYKSKGILSDKEVKVLLSYLDSAKKGTYDRADYLIVALAVSTGLRQGEIRALKAGDVHIVDEDLAYIEVSHAYSDWDGYKETKGKYSRETVVPVPLAKEVLAYSALNPDGYIFFSAAKPEVPQSAQFIGQKTYAAMDAVGITKKDREERNISFHSLRHYYVTAMSERLDTETVMEMSGHKSASMHDRYNHTTENKLRKAAEEHRKTLPFDFGKKDKK